MGVLYAALAAGLTRKAKDALWGFCGPFFGIAVPMAVLTRTAEWKGVVEAPDPRWLHATLLVFVFGVWGTVLALGWKKAGWRGALGTLGGALGAYFALVALLTVVPNLSNWPWATNSFWPQPTALLDGLLAGAGMALGLSLSRRKDDEKRSRA